MTEKRILLIEDEYLIAVEILSALKRAGFTQVEHVATEQEASECIEAGGWDAVLADANLNGRGIGPVFAALNQLQIPYMILTGYSRESLPPEAACAPVINKPFSSLRLVQAVTSLCTGPAPTEQHAS